MDPKQIILQLKSYFEKDSAVVAFVLVGSQARDSVYVATKHSDLEAYIIIKDEKAEEFEKKLPNLAKKLGKVLFSFKHAIGFVVVYEDLFRLELPVIRESAIKSIFNRPKAQVVKVLIDKTDGKLVKVLNDRPESIDLEKFYKDKVINYWYWQIIGVQYFKKGELYNARVVLGIISSGLVKLFEMLNDPSVLLLESNKRIEQFLTTAQLDELKKVNPLYEKESVRKSLLEMLEIFPRVAKEVATKYEYEFPTEIEKQVRPKIAELLK